MVKLSDAEIQKRLAGLDGWSLVESDPVPAIEKVINQGDFLAGLAFVTRVAVLAENAHHHPDVTLTYPRVTLRLTTHDAGGLTTKDFDLAARIDGL